MRNSLQLGRGDGTWAQIADFAGVAASDWTWGSAFLDVDLDGYEDLIVAAGHRWDVRDADTFERIRNSYPRVPWNQEQKLFPRLAVPNMVFRNGGDLHFSGVNAAGGVGRGSANSHRLALAGLGRGRALHVVVAPVHAAPGVHHQQSKTPRRANRLQGPGTH